MCDEVPSRRASCRLPPSSCTSASCLELDHAGRGRQKKTTVHTLFLLAPLTKFHTILKPYRPALNYSSHVPYGFTSYYFAWVYGLSALHGLQRICASPPVRAPFTFLFTYLGPFR